MRKFAAILLFTIFLFNLIGYRFWFNYVQQQSDTQLQASLDKDQYNDSELIAIRIPLSMPYQTVQSDFERVDGEVKVNNTIYKYVKRKIVDGEMILMCLPDHDKMRIQSEKNDFFKSANDIAQNGSSKKSDNAKTNVFKSLVSDYDHQTALYSLAEFNNNITQFSLAQSGKLLSSPHNPPVQPPDTM